MIDPTFLVAAMATAGFYGLISLPAMQDTMVHRYATEHAVEYVIVALFIWGAVDILFKLAGMPQELAALRQDWLPPRAGRVPASQAGVWLDSIRQRPRWLQQSRIGLRLTRALEQVLENHPGDDFHVQLENLSAQDAENLHASYSLPRFIIWISPILGFLGTVIHFGIAFSGISINQISERMPEIVNHLGTAFNTTTAALATTITMMVAVFLCERIDRRIGRSIDQYLERELASRFETRDPSIAPFLQAVQGANETTLHSLTRALDMQLDTWHRAVETLQQTSAELRQGEIESWQQMLDTMLERQAALDARREERLETLLSQIHAGQVAHQTQITAGEQRLAAAQDQLAGLMTGLRDLAGGEQKLAELQAVLTDNLRVLSETQQIDQALHGLTAAIHLLTARNGAALSSETTRARRSA